MKESENAAGSFWTLQEFTPVGRTAWYALQQHTGAGVARQYTGSRHELEHLAEALGIAPRLLPATTETEFWRTCRFEEPNMREAHVDLGICRGPFVAITPHSIVPAATSKNFVTNSPGRPEEGLPDVSNNVVVPRSSGRASVLETPLRELPGKARGLSR